MDKALHARYMKATATYRAHSETCTSCSPTTARCAEGRRLYESFTRLQDAYLAQQRRG
ncbi:hypothetical protein [Streptomyces sp. NPDC050485]|uniref:hypothetical protein n=1 Tax=Streptomyces sp. NPDC050485 TaxID=3365617 RepID=UPI0037A2B1E4